MSGPIKITRSIAYTQAPDGRIGVSLLVPWDGQPRLRSFPLRIRLAVQCGHHLCPTVEENAKLWAAKLQGHDVYAAVWDDILCVRAAEMLAREAAADARAAQEYLLVYGDYAQPAWLQKLRAMFSERVR